MKKLLLSAFVLCALSACKKQEPTSETPTNTDSVAVNTIPEKDSVKVNLKEISPKELSENISKNNDTLYVTNFFATWCGPCMMEMPHFKKKVEELKGKPVKFLFVNIYNKPEWTKDVPAFAEESGLKDQIVLLDDSKLDPSFFDAFTSWKGNNIPYTFFRKGNKTDEALGGMPEEVLDAKLKSFIQ
ncbi:redoxin [Chryseobacterium sp. Leaf404]|uniref:TlpA family protein disulfide reductase n=1 Tax=unclassified Chryseobacterium TaxID=2593645 RepID=UPI0006F8B7C8|nr:MULTISPECIES: TlpA disulfide reductase family protein [unclassified Chryseobacterium]KQT18301.1 redoxin [Chryseobacterium sp. Leaf404]